MGPPKMLRTDIVQTRCRTFSDWPAEEEDITEERERGLVPLRGRTEEAPHEFFHLGDVLN